MTFTGFPPTGLAHLTTLGTKKKDWFQANRAIYDDEVAQPAKDFVVAMTEQLQTRLSPLVEGQPKTNGSIAPINNDLRFNPEASPYKDHLLLKWWEGDNKKTAPTLWVRLSEESVGFASGIMITDVDRWRAAVGNDTGAVLAEALQQLSPREGLDIAGLALKKVPAPWPDGHPRADLLRHKGFQVRWAEPTPAEVGTVGFASWCTDRLVQLADVHRWLATHLS